MSNYENAKIRVGVLGAWRGMAFAANAQGAGMELVAVCDTWEEKLNEAKDKYKVAVYTEFDKFLEHDMDAVILANYFHEHAPFAIKALNAGKHVMSETMACKTIAEGVELARAVERTGKIYMLAENYPYFAYNQEMKRLYQAGEIGEALYGEGEYNHPVDANGKNGLAPGMNHWRNHTPSTYYCSHALAPLMYITDTRPVHVSGLCMGEHHRLHDNLHVRRNDTGSVIICRMDNDAVFRIMGLIMPGHSVGYRLHGTRGAMESMRSTNPDMLRVFHEEWDMREGDVRDKIYLPEFPIHTDMAKIAGHMGGDFFTNYYFAEAIRENKQPYLNVYKALDMALVSILSYKSAHLKGAPFDIPDFRNEEERKKYENDDWSPFPEDRRPGQPYASYKGEFEPSEEAIASAKKKWEEMGYKGE